MLAKEDDPPIVIEGGIWKVSAPIDAFIHTADRMNNKHFELLESAFQKVFSAIRDDDHEKELSNSFGMHRSPYSDWLREGLANTLLMIAALGKQAEVDIDSDHGKSYVDRNISQLPGLNGNVELLACIKNELPLLAEAAPVPFLLALERWLEGNAGSLREIFTEEQGMFFPTTYHSGLLWALETLVWGTNTFARSVLLLARLAEIDPGGNLVNRPINSLKEVFLPWMPNTGATLEQRNSMLVKLAKETPDVAWKLLVDLLPNRITSSDGTLRPQFREAATSTRTSVTGQQYRSAIAQIIELVIDLAIQKPLRWLEIVRDLSAFPDNERNQALKALRLYLTNAPEAERQPIWEALQDRTNDHKRIPEAQWSLTAEDLIPFEELVKEFKPESPVSSNKWIFNSWDFPTESGKTVESLRADTIKELVEKFGVEIVVELGHEVKQPCNVVEALEKVGLDFAQLSKILHRSLEEQGGIEFSIHISGLLQSVARADQAEQWLAHSIASEGLSDLTTANLLLLWPMTTDTWFVAKRLGESIFQHYWSLCNGYRLKGARRSFLRGLLYFLRAGRGSAFLESTERCLEEVPSRLILMALNVLKNEISAGSSRPDTMTSYYLERVFTELDARADVDVSNIIKQELVFLPFLDERNLRLHQQMAVDPKQFHQMICLVFKSDHDTEQITQNTDDRARRRLAYSVLSKFKQLPGHIDNDVNAKKLTVWVDEVRRLGGSTGHSEITDIYVGHLFAHAPVDNDDGWPHCVVRDEIERIGSEALETGIQTERYNMRGVTTRNVYDGGDQERELEVRYREWQTISGSWLRTSAMLGAIAKNWEGDAKSHDVVAAQRMLKS